jgi:hypothetical protein
MRSPARTTLDIHISVAAESVALRGSAPFYGEKRTMTYVCEQVCVVFHIIASPRPVVIARPYIAGNKQVEMTKRKIEETVSKEIFFQTQSPQRIFAKFARGNSVGDINFAPFGYAELTFANSLRSLRLNRLLKQNFPCIPDDCAISVINNYET